MTPFATELHDIVVRHDRNRFVGSAAISVSHSSLNGALQFAGSVVPQQHFIASATKPMLAVALVRALTNAGLTVDVPARSIDPELMQGFPYAESLTVRNLLAHTSGLFDYWRVHGLKAHRGKEPLAEWAAAHPGWTIDEVAELVRRNAPAARPDARVSYCGTNYQFATRIVETLTGLSANAALTSLVFEPAGMVDSYLFTHETLNRFDSIAPVLLGAERYNAPRRMASLGGEGGVVATLSDTNAFLEWMSIGGAFEDQWQTLTRGGRSFIPGIDYGLGVMSGTLPRLLTHWRGTPSTTGHFGMTGFAMMSVDGTGWRVSTTVNQLQKQILGTRLYADVLLAISRHPIER